MSTTTLRTTQVPDVTNAQIYGAPIPERGAGGGGQPGPGGPSEWGQITGNIANQGDLYNMLTDRVTTTSIADDLNTSRGNVPLSANQGRVLNGMVGDKVNKSDIIHNLQGGATNQVLGADMGLSINGKLSDLNDEVNLRLLKSNVVDNLTTDDSTKALSAKQGRALKQGVDGKQDITQASATPQVLICPTLTAPSIVRQWNMAEFTTRLQDSDASSYSVASQKDIDLIPKRLTRSININFATVFPWCISGFIAESDDNIYFNISFNGRDFSGVRGMLVNNRCRTLIGNYNSYPVPITLIRDCTHVDVNPAPGSITDIQDVYNSNVYLASQVRFGNDTTLALSVGSFLSYYLENFPQSNSLGAHNPYIVVNRGSTVHLVTSGSTDRNVRIRSLDWSSNIHTGWQPGMGSINGSILGMAPPPLSSYVWDNNWARFYGYTRMTLPAIGEGELLATFQCMLLPDSAGWAPVAYWDARIPGGTWIKVPVRFVQGGDDWGRNIQLVTDDPTRSWDQGLEFVAWDMMFPARPVYDGGHP